MKLDEIAFTKLQYELMEVLELVSEHNNALAEIRLMEIIEDVKFSEVM